MHKIKKNILLKATKWIMFYLLFMVVFGYCQASPSSFYHNTSGYSSSDILQSKENQSFIKELSIEPKSFKLDGRSVEVNEVWAEHPQYIAYVIVLVPFLYEIPIYKNDEKKFFVGINFKEYHESIKSLQNYVFSIDTEGVGYGIFISDSNVSISLFVDDLNWKELKFVIRPAGNWRKIAAKDITILNQQR